MVERPEPTKKWCTVAPINPCYQDRNGLFSQEIDMSHEIRIVPLPEWVREDPVIEDLGEYEKDRIRKATHYFITYYEARDFGSRDPMAAENDSRGIQEIRLETAF